LNRSQSLKQLLDTDDDIDVSHQGHPTRRSVRLLVMILGISLIAVAAVVVVPTTPATAASGSTLWIDEGFESASWDRSTTWWNWLAGDYISKTQVAGIEGNGTRITMKPGRHDAAMLNYQFNRHDFEDPSEAYFRYWLRFDDLPEDSGKLPGFMALYSDSARGNVRPSEAQPGWSARVLYGPGSTGRSVQLGYYLYWLNQASTVGDKLWWNQEIPLGAWSCIEGRVSMNTPGTPNGGLDAWINGTQVFGRNDVLYRSASQPNVKIRDFMFEVLYGGPSTPPKDTSVSFDSLVVSDQRVGCDTAAPNRFTDTDGSTFIADIEWLAAQGITKGCNPTANTRFCPGQVVSRGQMAAFLRRALDGIIPVAPSPAPPPAPPNFWGAAVGDYKAALANMPTYGYPLDTIELNHDLSNPGWLSTGPSDIAMWAPTQMSNVHNAGAVPYVLLSVPDISRFSKGGASEPFDAWVRLVSKWLGEDPTRRLLVAPFSNANNGRLAYGDDAPAFIAAYRRVYTAIRDSGLGADRVRFVYQMSAELTSSRYSASYGSGFGLYSPGPSYIDLAAVWWLNDGSPSWDDWDRVYGPRVEEMGRAVGQDVPVLLSMVGSVPSASGGTRSDWFAGIGAGIASSSTAIGFQYFDWSRGSDYRVNTDGTPDPSLLAALAAMNLPHDRLGWVFGELDGWKAQTRASSMTGLFSDDDGSVFESDIAWLSRSGITRGCGERLYCPQQQVTRGQMAAFLHRALGNSVTPTGAPGVFTDIADSPFAADIAWLSATGITKGCNPSEGNTKFCPDRPVTRGQMAAFLHRALRDLVG